VSRWRDDGDDEFVAIPVEEFKGTTPKAVIVMVGGEEHFVGQSVVDNFDDIKAHLANPDDPNLKVEEIEVPLWLARDNGWEAEED
jgi:hypothetical protein